MLSMASQYVDDAVKADIQHHEKGNKLAPIVTAHRIIEIMENRDVDDQPFVWVPFHFFPGNEGKNFTERLICRKDSPLINELIDHYLEQHKRPFALALWRCCLIFRILNGASNMNNRPNCLSVTIRRPSLKRAKHCTICFKDSYCSAMVMTKAQAALILALLRNV